MNTGQYISGVGHAAVILWALVGGIFLRADDSDVIPAAEVTLLTGEEFAALTAPTLAPTAGLETPIPDAPQPDPAPEVETAPEARPTQPTPTPPEPETPDSAPEPPTLETPQAEVTPEVKTPEPPSLDAGDVVAPEASDRPVPRAAPRVAPQPVIAPDPTPQVAETPAPAVAPDAPSDQVAEEQPEATPEEATTEIVTEAEEPAGLTSSPRPRARPARPEPVQTAAPETAPETQPEAQPDTQSPASVANDIAAAIGGGQEVGAPSGPPLTFSEREGLRVAVQACWNVDVGSAASNTVVTVEMQMNRDGTVVANSLRMIGSDGPDASTAFAVARRAILRCQRGGYKLPSDKFDHWQTIEMTFNPENMRQR